VPPGNFLAHDPAANNAAAVRQLAQTGLLDEEKPLYSLAVLNFSGIDVAFRVHGDHV
jgi:hypothetical protein